MTAVVISLIAVSVLFAVDICIQVFTAKKDYKVVKYRERKYEQKSLYPNCVFIDFECPRCKEHQHTVIEYMITEPKIFQMVRRKIRHCPNCGCNLEWR